MPISLITREGRNASVSTERRAFLSDGAVR